MMHTLSIDSEAPVMNAFPSPLHKPTTFSPLATPMSQASTNLLEPPDDFVLDRTSSQQSTMSLPRSVRTYSSRTTSPSDDDWTTSDFSSQALVKQEFKPVPRGRMQSKNAQEKEDLKAAHRLWQAARLAHSACEAEAHLTKGDVASIDEKGILHGALQESDITRSMNAYVVDRKKCRHRARVQRRHSFEGAVAADGSTLCAGPDGKVFLYLTFEGDADKVRRLARKRALLQRQRLQKNGERLQGTPFVVDKNGVICL
eukprot:TRINITY_DN1829_c0_g2_i1.p1 TRINITY_DN1829_c0_g2~~TRINITY_DN1829_c0_g2_i1.p1  ORF type:complete len:285 (-),score=54.01 TRINITY_DN1829_c0_g2_i1:99-869(-)